MSLEEIKKEAVKEVNEVKNLSELNNLKVKYFGKAGLITEELKNLRNVPNEEKAKRGAEINLIKKQIEEIIAENEKSLKAREMEEKLLNEEIDVTLDINPSHIGSLHPLTIEINKISNILTSLGFVQVDGPEIELDKYNFEMLNVPKDHPARDMQDTFYITDNILLRSQTSNTQARAMLNLKPPFKVFSPGRVFRNDLDATHIPAFYQIEGMYVDENVSMADLKNVLLQICRSVFGLETKIRFRSSYFPFTEPSVEVDISCPYCSGKGCNLCKNTKWIEILGAGMVHPNVLEAGGIDSTKYSGYAFGFGLDRVAMLDQKVNDIRHFVDNNIKFLKMFK